MHGAVVGLMAAAIAVSARAQPSMVEVVQPWSRPAAAGATGAGFMTLVNRSAKAQALTGVSSPMARKVEIHRSSMTGGVMSMRRQDRVEIPAGGEVAFAPGGYHLMFMDLAKPLRVGDALPATLSFSGGGQLSVRFVVGARAPGRHH
jgi:periplasmic copper chaperone A